MRYPSISYRAWPTVRTGRGPLSTLHNRFARAMWEFDVQPCHWRHIPTWLDVAESVCPALAKVTGKLGQP